MQEVCRFFIWFENVEVKTNVPCRSIHSKSLYFLFEIGSVCLGIHTQRYVYMYMCVWHRLFLKGLGKMAPFYYIQISGDVSRMFMDYYSRREYCSSSPIHSVILLVCAMPSLRLPFPMAVLLLRAQCWNLGHSNFSVTLFYVGSIFHSVYPQPMPHLK